MRIVLPSLFLALCTLSLKAQPFVVSLSGPGTDVIGDIATDAAGNIYAVGSFDGTLDFDPGPGTYNLTAANRDIFVLKLDASGNFVWAKSVSGGGAFDSGNDITVDGLGNVYSTGNFGSTADFDPGPSTYNLTAVGFGDVFVLKLDANGDFLWARQIKGNGSDFGNGVAVDGSGNVYSTGYFVTTADFDPGSGTYNLTSNGSSDAFVLKLDASGNFVWAKNIGGSNADNGQGVAVDGSGNVYSTGYFYVTVDFDPGSGTYNLTSNGSSDAFVLKLDASGNFVWAKNIGGIDFESGNDITVDGSGNIYTIGNFFSTVDFDPGSGTYNLTSNGSSDAFVLKLDASGNFVWAKNIGGSNADYSRGVAVDGSGNVYTTGEFFGTADFDPGSGTYNLTSNGSSDAFVLKLDASGNFVWAKQISGSGQDFGNGVVVDGSGNVFVTGTFDGTADFDPGLGTYNLTSNGGTADAFILKLNSAGALSTLPLRLVSFKATVSGGGIQLRWATASEESTKAFVVEKKSGNQLFAAVGTVAAKGSGDNSYTYQDHVSNTEAVYYRLRMVDNNGQYTFSPIARVSSATGSASFAVYPNPVIGGKAVLQLVDRNLLGSVVKLMDMTGHTVWQATITSNRQPLEMQGLPKGLYVLQVGTSSIKITVE